jgi:hypothetical protein
MYGHAVVGRAGLANLLFPWARCEVFCHTHQIPMLAPQWTAPKIGPLLRRESDLRFYVGLFSDKPYIRGLKKWTVLLRATKVPETAANSLKGGSGVKVVLFQGLEGFFDPLLAHQAYVSQRLYDILSDKSREALESHTVDYEIAVHVRKGDKPPIAVGETPPAGQWGWTLPNAWYLSAIQSIRAALGRDAPVRIFSDGQPDQLRDLLALPKVTLSPSNSAIVDIFLLSRAKVLIPSPTSTFSWWGAFLGQMPTIWYPGWRQRLHPGRDELDLELTPEGQLSADLPAAA